MSARRGASRICVWPVGGVALLCALTAAAAHAADAKVRIAPPPAWVQPEAIATDPPPADQVRGGWYWSLIDLQENATVRPRQRYSHVGLTVVNDEGVQNASTLSMDFDPAYERLTVHAIRIHRGGRTIEKLTPGAVKILQRERRLEEDIYEGTQTAMVVLDDVRRGDVVEYAYTLTGSNPVFGDAFESMASPQGGTAIQRWRLRLLWNRDRPLFVRAHGGTLEATSRDSAGATEMRWQRDAVEPYTIESDVPDWYDHQAWLQLTSFASWSDVARWGAALYDRPGGRQVTAQVAALRTAAPDLAGQARAAVRFVQEDVRYFANTLGPGSHRPNAPDVVIERRFGDCKDKSLLLVALLRGLGLEADVALVSTTRRAHLEPLLPSPLDFDHVIVRSALDGASFFVDPTLRGQGGGLTELTLPPYGRALVLRSDTTAPTDVPPQGPAPRIDIHHVVHVPSDDANLGRLEVRTTYTGAEAEEVRLGLQSDGRAEVERHSQRYYRAIYPTLEIAAPLDVRDDLAANQLRITESYRLPEFWTRREAGGRGEAEIYALEIGSALPRAQAGRTQPVAIEHPRHIVAQIDIHAAAPLPLKALSGDIDNEALTFSYHTLNNGTVGSRFFELRTRTDAVAPAQLGGVVRDVADIRDALSIMLHETKPVPLLPSLADLNWLLVAHAVLTLIAATAAALWWMRRSPPQPAPDEAPAIAGALAFLGFGVVATPFVLLLQMHQTASMFDAAVWRDLTTPGTATYRALFAPTIIFEVSLNMVLLVGSVVLAILFFRRQRLFRSAYIVFGLVGVIGVAIDLALASQVSEPAHSDLSRLMQPLIVLLIWGTYLWRSSRARATFVR